MAPPPPPPQGIGSRPLLPQLTEPKMYVHLPYFLLPVVGRRLPMIAEGRVEQKSNKGPKNVGFYNNLFTVYLSISEHQTKPNTGQDTPATSDCSGGECETGGATCSHVCTNTVGSYYCDCPPGEGLGGFFSWEIKTGS